MCFCVYSCNGGLTAPGVRALAAPGSHGQSRGAIMDSQEGSVSESPAWRYALPTSGTEGWRLSLAAGEFKHKTTVTGVTGDIKFHSQPRSWLFDSLGRPTGGNCIQALAKHTQCSVTEEPLTLLSSGGLHLHSPSVETFHQGPQCGSEPPKSACLCVLSVHHHQHHKTTIISLFCVDYTCDEHDLDMWSMTYWLCVKIKQSVGKIDFLKYIHMTAQNSRLMRLWRIIVPGIFMSCLSYMPCDAIRRAFLFFKLWG